MQEAVMKRFIFLIIPLGILFIFSITCKKNTTAIETQPEPEPEPKEFEISDFPNTPGWHFTYLVKDSTVQPRIDTVVVDIVGDTLLPGNRTATIWRYQYPNITDTMYAWAHEDTLRFYTQWEGNYAQLLLVFPLKIGNQWRGDFTADTVTVLDKQPVEVIAGHFAESYRLRHFFWGPNAGGLEYLWLVPDVGIVKMDLNDYLLSQYWELIGYSFPE
ncbi:MAG: hypothetical protein D6732_12330 [Methanobacteriota archaeon]|nr:MAG: hypothetical protein D6732_12330 [Euryarchaeota archaeon]